MQEPPGSEAADAGRFYDALRASGLSSAALAYGDTYIGQECLLTADEILAFARRAGITAGTSMLDIGSGTGGPACYLARELGCRALGVDVSAVGHAQAEARARDNGLTHLVAFRLGDIHAIELAAGTFDVVIGLYAQHLLMPRVPALWRLHRVHHADPAFDASTKLRSTPWRACSPPPSRSRSSSPSAPPQWRS